MEERRKSLREQNNLIQVSECEYLEKPYIVCTGDINNCLLVNTYQVNTGALVSLEDAEDFNIYTLIAVKEYVVIENKPKVSVYPKIPQNRLFTYLILGCYGVKEVFIDEIREIYETKY